MSSFLTRLVDRTLGLSEVVQPMVKPLFAREVPQPLSAEPSSTGIEPASINPVSDKDTVPEKSLDSNRVADNRQNHKTRTLLPTDNQLDTNSPPIADKKVITEMPFQLNKTKSHSSQKTIESKISKQTEEPGTGILSDRSKIDDAKSLDVKTTLIQPAEPNTLIEKIHISNKEEHTLVPTYNKGYTRPYGSDYQEKKIEAMVDGYPEKGGAASTAPTIKVTIGRIDVRAVMQQTPSPQRRVTPTKPKLSLDDYLKQRGGGER